MSSNITDTQKLATIPSDAISTPPTYQAPWFTLPDELKIRILKYCDLVLDEPLRPPTQDVRRLTPSVSLVCRDFNRIASDIFYAKNTFVVKWAENDKGGYFLIAPNRHVRSFIRRLEVELQVRFVNCFLEKWVDTSSDWGDLFGANYGAPQWKVPRKFPWEEKCSSNVKGSGNKDALKWRNYFPHLDYLKVILTTSTRDHRCLHGSTFTVATFPDRLRDAGIAFHAKRVEVVVQGTICGKTCPYKCTEGVASTICKMINDATH